MGFHIPDPRFEMPALLTPGRKPTGPVVIDHSHPIGAKCSGVILFDQKLNFNGTKINVNGTAPAFVSRDGNLQLDDWGATAGLELLGKNAELGINGSKFTVIFKFWGLRSGSFERFMQGGGTGYANTFLYNNGNTTNLTDFSHRLNNQTINTTMSRDYLVNSATRTRLPGTLAFSWDDDLNYRDVYLDGVLETHTTSSFSGVAWGTDLYLFCEDSVPGFVSNGIKEYVMFFPHFLSAAEIKSLYYDDYQFLIPA